MNKNPSQPQSQSSTQGHLVDDVMSRDPITIAPHANLNTAAHIMWTQERGCLPVVEEDGRVIGILTDRDIAMCSYTQGLPLPELAVRLAMQTEVVCARVGDDRDVAEALMEANDVHRLPVLDDDGHVVGIVSRTDFAEARERTGARFTMHAASQSASQAASQSPSASMQMPAAPGNPRNGAESARTRT